MYKEEIYTLDQKDKIKQNFSFWCFSWNRRLEKRRKGNKDKDVDKQKCHDEKTLSQRENTDKEEENLSHFLFALFIEFQCEPNY